MQHHEPLDSPEHNLEVPIWEDVERRNFLKGLGLSFAAISLPSCKFRPPEEKIVPYMEKPEEVTIGKSSWYASTCGSCAGGCGILVKNRDGRPIKIEGNPDHPLNVGGLCARGQASILDLYDSQRLKHPQIRGKGAKWEEIDAAILSQLEQIQKKGGQIRILSTTSSSPSFLRMVSEFNKFYPGSKHVVYDAVSQSAILEAHAMSHGKKVLPWYRFDKAKTIVSFDADFLGTWISPSEFTRGWSLNRKIEKHHPTISWHAQIEARLSLTGANADKRVALKPSQYLSAILQLAEKVSEKLYWNEKKRLPSPLNRPLDPKFVESAAEHLVSAKGRSLVLSGVNDVQIQMVVNFLNYILQNYGATLDLFQPSLQAQGDDHEMERLIHEMNEGKISALFWHNANPAYHSVNAHSFKEGLKKVGLTVALSSRLDETASLAQYVCPDPHGLESWYDAHPHYGVYSLYQPMIAPLYDARSVLESLSQWIGKPQSMYQIVQQTWKEQIFTLQNQISSFENFWEDSVRKGVALIDQEKISLSTFHDHSISRIKNTSTSAPSTNSLELVVYPSIALGDGTQANNPWLQELPDPISKTTWGNCASLSPKTAKKLKVVEGRVVEIRSETHNVKLPIQIQPGLPENVVAVALGYGRTHAGEVMANYPVEKMLPLERELLSGADMYPFVKTAWVSLQIQNEMLPLAKTQQYDYQKVPFTQQIRPIVLSTTVQELEKEPSHRSEKAHNSNENVSLWPEHEYPGHKWGMAIDLNACTGCSGCLLACQSENNVPVVGKIEIAKSREMHWLRMDRYYTGSEEEQEENPDVSFMPMMCQQCDHAPCETVCPVLATVHSSEGLNMQVYNRCVGTRYCANNCPYKTRRFNWFDYAHQDPVQNLVLNPDITVRTRGVMEKCTFCVQRITEGKIHAKSEGRKPLDGEIQPACAQSCPAKAIVFGDVNDPHSAVSKALKDPRSYFVLEEIQTKPSVNYLKKVRNREG